MTEILLLIITILQAVIAAFLVPTLIELRNASKNLSGFLSSTEGSLKPALEELNAALKDFREISADINTVAKDAKKFSSAVGAVADNIKEINDIVGAIPVRLSGIKAGLGAALGVLLTSFFKKNQ